MEMANQGLYAGIRVACSPCIVSTKHVGAQLQLSDARDTASLQSTALTLVMGPTALNSDWNPKESEAALRKI